MLSARLELSSDNLHHNVRMFRSLLAKTNAQTMFCAVVKSNAYGHGLKEIVAICLESKVDAFAVNTLEEARIVRNLAPNHPILVMGDIPFLDKRVDELRDPRYWILVSRLEEWRFLAQLDPRPRIHLKIDTGMGRLGCNLDSLPGIFETAKSEQLPLEGISTHFASTEDFTEHSYSQKQLSQFRQGVRIAESFGYHSLIRHCAASASALLFDEARMDLVRVGISLYGLWPSIETKLSMSLLDRPMAVLKPVLQWKTTIQHTKEVPTGTYIGYGSTYKTTYPTRIGILPVGYYEGLDRKLSNNGYFLIHGERARILGRICMNMCMVDITHIPHAQLGDEVVIIGESGTETLTADDLAAWTHTINYETVTRILSLLPRTVVNTGNNPIIPTDPTTPTQGVPNHG